MHPIIIEHDLDKEPMGYIDADAEMAAGRIHIWSCGLIDRREVRERRRRRHGWLRRTARRCLDQIASGAAAMAAALN